MGDMEELQVNTPTAREMINTVYGEINNQRAILLNTDWCVIKCRETGQSMQELYPDVSAVRTTARARINDLEAKLPALQEMLAMEEADEVIYM